jgi:hypothetical protein
VYREVVADSLDCHSGSCQWAFERLERSDAKYILSSTKECHGPFLGGGEAVMPPCYPTGYSPQPQFCRDSRIRSKIAGGSDE